MDNWKLDEKPIGITIATLYISNPPNFFFIFLQEMTNNVGLIYSIDNAIS